MKIWALPETYAHVKEHQETGSSPVPDRHPLYPLIRKMLLLGATSPAFAPRIGAAQGVEERLLS